jgi:hypothetical protein
MPGIDITVTGTERNARRIMAVGERALDYRPIFSVLSDDWDELVDEQFETEGRRSLPGGWRRLSESRIKQKAAQDLDPRIMHATLALRNSLTKKGARGSIRRIRPHLLLRGTSIFYAPYHHNPSSGSRLPRRPIYIFTNRDRAAWHDVMQDFIISGRVRSPSRWLG